MTVPVYPWTVWIVAALDPILIGLALYLGYTASQFGKVFIAAIIALAAFAQVRDDCALAWVDISTGALRVALSATDPDLRRITLSGDPVRWGWVARLAAAQESILMARAAAQNEPITKS